MSLSTMPPQRTTLQLPRYAPNAVEVVASHLPSTLSLLQALRLPRYVRDRAMEQTTLLSQHSSPPSLSDAQTRTSTGAARASQRTRIKEERARTSWSPDPTIHRRSLTVFQTTPRSASQALEGGTPMLSSSPRFRSSLPERSTGSHHRAPPLSTCLARRELPAPRCRPSRERSAAEERSPRRRRGQC